MHDDFEYCGYNVRIHWETRGKRRWFGGAILQRIGVYENSFSTSFLQPSTSVDKCIEVTTESVKKLIDQYIADAE